MIRLAIPSKRSRAPLAKSPALRAGQSYERRVSAWLEREHAMISQVEFEDVYCSSVARFIPDGLVFDFAQRRLLVVEIKTQWNEAASKQLLGYMEKLATWWPGEVKGLGVCQAHDGAWPVISSPAKHEKGRVALLTTSRYMLPRISDGLGDTKFSTLFAVRAGRGSGNDSDRIRRSVSMVPS